MRLILALVVWFLRLAEGRKRISDDGQAEEHRHSAAPAFGVTRTPHHPDVTKED